MNTAIALDPTSALDIRVVHPDECVLWSHHNRNLDLLDEVSCEGLITSFTHEGVQRVPAIARLLPKPKGKVKYEIVAGCRRHWTARYVQENGLPEFEFKILVESLTDVESFRASNLENLERDDISAYERGLDYKKAVQLYYEGSQVALALDLGKPESWVSEHISLSELPIQIPNAFAKWSDLRLHHLRTLKALLSPKRKKMLTAVLSEATNLHLIHIQRARARKKPLAGSRVVRILKAAGKPTKQEKTKGKSYGPPSSPHLQVKSANAHVVSISVSKTSEASIDDLVASFRQCLEDHLSK